MQCLLIFFQLHSPSSSPLGGFYCSSEIRAVCLLMVNEIWKYTIDLSCTAWSTETIDFPIYLILFQGIRGYYPVMKAHKTALDESRIHMSLLKPSRSSYLRKYYNDWPWMCPFRLKMMSSSLALLQVNLSLLSHPLLSLLAFLLRLLCSLMLL